jgi:YggT family protein
VRLLLDAAGLLLWLFMIVLVLRLVLDWVQYFAKDIRPRGPLLVLAEAVYTITDPPLRAIRRVIPPLKFGGFGLDLAFMVLFFAVIILQNVLARL